MWVTGEPWVYKNWDPPTEPNDNLGEDFLEMLGLSGTWNDIDKTPDSQNVGYIVEYDSSIPTVSQWGLLVMAFLLLGTGVAVFRTRGAPMA